MTQNIKYIDKNGKEYSLMDIENYVARTKNDKQILKDWGITKKWYVFSIKGKTTIPKEIVMDFSSDLLREARIRGIEPQLQGTEFYNATERILSEKKGFGDKFINYIKGIEHFAKWSTVYINNLPDSAFALIEKGGEKTRKEKLNHAH